MAKQKVKPPDTRHPERSDLWRQHMPAYADMCPVCSFRIRRAGHITALHKSLVQFGYPTLTREEVEAAYDAAIAHTTDSANVIHLLVRSQMQEVGLA